MPTSFSKILPVILIMAMVMPTLSYISQQKMLNEANATVLEVIEIGLNLIENTITAIKTALIAINTAITATNGVLSFAFNTWVQNVFKVLLEYFKLKLLDMLSTQIVNWITGGKLGGPQYVTNWANFLGQAASDARDIVINEVDKASGGLICTSFANQLRNLLRFNSGVPGLSGLQLQLSCTLDRFVQNINTFYYDFSQGGWQGYITLLQPNNNYYGNMIAILDTEQLLAAAKQRAAQNEALSGQGFLSVKRCKTPDDSFGPGGCAEWEVTTPGKALAATVDSALTNRFGYITGMNQFASIIAILTDSVLNKLIGVGVNGLLGYSASNPAPTYLAPGKDFTNCASFPPGAQQDACNAAKQATAPAVTLTASATTIKPGDSLSLFWAGINASSCQGTNFSTNDQTSGSVNFTLATTTTYAVTCTNASGDAVTKFATVTVCAASATSTTGSTSATTCQPAY